MSSASNPISVWTRRDRAAAAVAAPALLTAVLWAWWPLPRSPGPDPTPTATEPSFAAAEPPEAFDRQAFAATIWNPPPPPEQPAERATREATPPTARLQLIGIARDPTEGGHVLRAALYDPDTDTLHIVAAGERIGALTILAVEPGLVRLDTGGGPGELHLRQEERGS